MRLFYLFLFTTTIFSCNPIKNKLVTNQMLVSYESKSCYGKCAEFKIKINFDNSIEYEGFKNVENIGNFKFEISDKDYKEVFKLISNLDFMSIDSVYTSKSTDLHLRILEINNSNEIKKILLLDNVPQKLSNIEYKINSILNKLILKKI